MAKSTLKEYWKAHHDSEEYLKTWHDAAMNADWQNPIEIKQAYANASILRNSRIVFNIKGNSYRLAVIEHYSAHCQRERERDLTG